MQFKRGQSGNPSGHPPGLGHQARLKAAISDAQFDELVARIVTDALAGDAASTTLLMSRLCPQPKAVLEPVKFALTGDTLSDKANSILVAIADGILPADIGQSLISALAGVARVNELDEFERRLALLEAR